MAEPGKTEKATPKKREEARKRGQVVRSVEINSMLNVLVSLVVLRVFGEYIIHGFKRLATYFWSNVTTLSLSPDSMGSFMYFLIIQTVLIMLPILIVVFIVGIVSNVVQVGFLVTFEPLKPSFDKINPARGFKRIFSKRLIFETIKAVLKIGIIGYILFSTVKKTYNEIFVTPLMDIDTYFNFTANMVYKLGMKIVIAFIVFSIIDYLWQKYDYEDGLKMSKQEVKDELKQLEGDPLIKSRIRNIQREMARKRMISEIPQADVVITNPTHIAVAVRYKEGEDNAPVIVAKGKNFMAEKIKSIARKNSIIITENPPLARELVKLEVGWEIPPEFFKAVAEILAFV
ncbi:MAG TPA: flagellar biosynthesis protein FlhB, partial [Candidatus Goldiibacteriota bacterium]|nr:flagellar biosynthesis protein FlhB [Candidatus Goldiibacteriota bacterium]